jgi:hypothetical protein
VKIFPYLLTVQHIDKDCEVKMRSTVDHGTRAPLLALASSLIIVHRPGQQVDSVQVELSCGQDRVGAMGSEGLEYIKLTWLEI